MISLAATLATSSSQVGQAVAALTFVATDSDPYVTSIAVTVNWGDGQTAAYPRQIKPLQQDGLTHLYGAGRFVVTVTATNFKSTPETETFTSAVVVNYPENPTLPSSVQPVVYGPILPRQQGVPNSQQWNFNIGNDSRIVESSLRMLLLTAKGERLFNPNYGTSLRSLVFSPNISDLNSDIRQEIGNAVAQFVPQAQLLRADVTQTGRDATVVALFSNVIDQSAVSVVLNFSQA